MLIDTHAHLASEAFVDDYKEVLDVALSKNIGVIVVGSDMVSSRRAVRIAEECGSGVYAAVGLHPNRINDPEGSVKDFIDEDAYREMVVNPNVVAVGESGLDYGDLPESPEADSQVHKKQRLQQLQMEAFEFFLQLSYDTRLPLILHSRDAHSDVLGKLEYFDKKESVGFDSRGVVHGFEGDWEQAAKYMNFDFFLSFTGKLVDAHHMRNILKQTPEDRILVESGCPRFHPDRSGRNEPSTILETVAAMAEIKELETETMRVVLGENGKKSFPRIGR